MIRLNSTTVVWSLVCARTRPALLLLLLFTLANSIACNRLNASKPSGNTVFLNRDLSTRDLSQWTHRDFGLGTDAGSNARGAGYLWYHPDAGGRGAAGITVTPLAAHVGNVSIRNGNLVERSQRGSTLRAHHGGVELVPGVPQR